MKEQRFLVLCVLLMALIGGFGFAAGGAEGVAVDTDEVSGTVVWVSANPVPVVEKIAQMFEEKYPGVQVETLFMGANEAATRVEMEAANPQIDVWSGGGPFTRYPVSHLLESYVSVEDEAFSADFKDTEEHKWYGFSGPSQIILVNTDIIPPQDAPRSWMDLGDPRYRGQIILANPALSSSAFRQVTLMIHAGGWDLVERVVANSTVTPSSRLAWQGVGDGEFAIGIASENSVYSLMYDGYPIMAIMPEEGTNLSFDTVSIVKNSRNPAAARALLDFINSREAHEIIGQAPHFRPSVRPDVPPVAGVEGSIPRDTMVFVEYTEEEERMMTEGREEMLLRFDEIFERFGN